VTRGTLGGVAVAVIPGEPDLSKEGEGPEPGVDEWAFSRPPETAQHLLARTEDPGG
jgi:hypothetical protein